VEIGIFGASGVIGSKVLDEATSRGHRVTAFTRTESRIPAETGTVTWRVANVLDADSVEPAIAGLDVVVNAINAGNDLAETIANADTLPTAARALLTALEQHPATRVIVVGGGGSLEVRPGLQMVDVEGFAEKLPETLGAPQEYAKVVLAHREALNLYRLSNRNWTYLSPSAGLIQPGERTGRFRVGGNQLLVQADGTTGISAEDLAMAILDEIELPRHIQRRFTVGY
jgi:putative NADH-flavin reductase